MDTEKRMVGFYYEASEVRTLVIDGVTWFVAKDVCDILGLQNSHDVLSKQLDDDEKGVEKIYSPGGYQDTNVVNESGLYSLIFRSNKPEAKAFRKWVTSEVLPTIRKNGFYIAPEIMEKIEKLPELFEKFNKFKEQTVATYKKLEAHVDNDILPLTTDRAASRVEEYIRDTHKPSRRELQLKELARFFPMTFVITGNKKDALDLFRIYPSYEGAVKDPFSKDEFSHAVKLTMPEVDVHISNSGAVFRGITWNY
jgi:prophage antirepressor-like protein